MDLLEAVHGTKEWFQDILLNFLEDAGLEEEETCNEMISCYMELCETFDDVEKQLIKKMNLKIRKLKRKIIKGSRK